MFGDPGRVTVYLRLKVSLCLPLFNVFCCWFAEFLLCRLAGRTGRRPRWCWSLRGKIFVYENVVGLIGRSGGWYLGFALVRSSSEAVRSTCVS